MSYNSRIVREQGGSMMNVTSGGSITVASGAVVNISAGGAFRLGGNQFYFGSALPTISTSPGAFYFRSAGSASNFYINTTQSGTAGSVWSPASVNRP